MLSVFKKDPASAVDPKETERVGLLARQQALKRELLDAKQRKNTNIEIVRHREQLAAKRQRETLFLQRQRDAPEPFSFEDLEQHRRYEHELGQQWLQTQPAAEGAAAEVTVIDAEILGLEQALKGVERELFDQRTVVLLKALIAPTEHFISAQYELDTHVQSGREHGYHLQDLGVHLTPHPGATAADRREHAVADYLRFVLARLDPNFATTLGPDDAVVRMLAAAERGSGISAPGLMWA